MSLYDTLNLFWAKQIFWVQNFAWAQWTQAELIQDDYLKFWQTWDNYDTKLYDDLESIDTQSFVESVTKEVNTNTQQFKDKF